MMVKNGGRNNTQPRGVLTMTSLCLVHAVLLLVGLLSFAPIGVVLVVAQEETAPMHEQPPPEGAACDCANLQHLHKTCVDDFWRAENQRRDLEGQVATVEAQANERCQSQVAQVQEEGQVQVHQVKAEWERSIEDWKARVEQVKTELRAELEQEQRLANEQLVQCQSQKEELFGQVDTAHRRLQESSQEMEGQLKKAKEDKTKLEKDLSSREEALKKAKSESQKVKKELKETKKTLEEMLASKTIITIDYDLLQQRLDEIKAIVMEYVNKFLDFMKEQFDFAKKKSMEFYKYVQTDVFPKIERFVTKEAIPFMEKTWKQAADFWEKTYAPYRGPVNAKIKQAKKTWKKTYKQHLEPKVKEYKLDQHVAVAQAKAMEGKDKLEEYALLAHDKLLEGVNSATGIALNFVKLEKGPDFLISFLEDAHANYEFIVQCMEFVIIFFLVYFFLKRILFGKKKKSITKGMKKQQWLERQHAGEQVNGKQMTNKNKTQTNGAKLGKKKQK